MMYSVYSISISTLTEHIQAENTLFSSLNK